MTHSTKVDHDDPDGAGNVSVVLSNSTSSDELPSISSDDTKRTHHEAVQLGIGGQVIGLAY